jgi:TRAP-type C4-dicarboxylate transport system permease small subunit
MDRGEQDAKPARVAAQPGLAVMDRLSWWLAIAAGLVLSFLVGLTFTDVVLRYVFSAPLLGAKDILQMGMVVVVFLAAPYTWRIGGHIVVDLLPDYNTEVATLARDIIVRLFALLVFGLLTWQAWERAEESVFFGEATNMIEIPYRPFFYFLMLGAAVQSVILALETVGLARNRAINTTTLEHD